ncbi:MAG: inositol-3-phosphate synthase, partial [Candidatus Geothermarchaeales archaeon]
MGEIRVAVVGAGNLCSALIQGIEYYRRSTAPPRGLVYEELGGYGLRDIRVVAAVDIDERKVGRDLSEAIFSEPNVVERMCKVPRLGVEVVMGEVLDGVDSMFKGAHRPSSARPVDIVDVFRESKAEVVVNMVPSGAQEASEWYAQRAVEAGCGFINASSSFIASRGVWVEKFRGAGLPVVGDDLMDQIGSTILHKAVLELLHIQGAHVEKTYSLDVGGGAENLISLSKSRRRLKREIKSRSIRSVLPYDVGVVAGTTDYIEFMGNRRESHVRIDGTYFMDVPFHIDVAMETHDAVNGASVLTDVIRALKVALDRGVSGL